MESPTFRSAIEKIINELSSYYNNVESWSQILEMFDALSTDEEALYSSEIDEITIAINKFGDIDRKPNAKEMMQIVILLVSYQNLGSTNVEPKEINEPVISKKSKRSTKKSVTFVSVVTEILNNYSAITASKESLQGIVKMFDTLSREEEVENNAKIKSILDTMSEYDKFTGEITRKQIETLHTQLKTYRDYPQCKVTNYGGMLVLPEVKCYKGFQNIPVRKDGYDTLDDALAKLNPGDSFVNYHHNLNKIKNYNCNSDEEEQRKKENRLRKLWCGDQPFNASDDNCKFDDERLNKLWRGETWTDAVKTTQHIDGNGFKITHEFVKKLDLQDDEVISEVVFFLLTELGSNSGSGLTVPVYNYFDVIEGILESDTQRYEPITSEIKMCLIKHGWKCKNDDTVGGFHTQPNKIGLIDDLTMIINKYF